MSYLATSPRGRWLEFAADAYLDNRHRNWVLAEEVGDVVFVSARGVVLVHRERAEHVARALGARFEVMSLEPFATLPAPVPLRLPATPAPAPAAQLQPQRQPLVAGAGISRRDVLGWLGIVAGAAVLVGALAVPLDDPALVVALMLVLRGGRLIRDPGTLSVTVPAEQRGQEEHHAHHPGG
jgi:hypothetical protein